MFLISSMLLVCVLVITALQLGEEHILVVLSFLVASSCLTLIYFEVLSQAEDYQTKLLTKFFEETFFLQALVAELDKELEIADSVLSEMIVLTATLNEELPSLLVTEFNYSTQLRIVALAQGLLDEVASAKTALVKSTNVALSQALDSDFKEI